MERKRKKRHSLAIEEMRDRPVDGEQKLKKKRGRKWEQFVLVGKKKKIPGNFATFTLV